MIHAKFQPNILSFSGEKVDFIGFVIFRTGGHLGLSARQNFLLLKPYSLITPLVKFENYGCSGFRE